MLSHDDVLRLQREQFRHDKRNHCDILSLHKNDRLKHYGLHFCKYVGRLARGVEEGKSAQRTVVDTALVSLSAANTLHQKLSGYNSQSGRSAMQIDPLRPFADAAGRFADACEKIDHVEEFIGIARSANQDIMQWSLAFAQENDFDLVEGLNERRRQLADRQFFIHD